MGSSIDWHTRLEERFGPSSRGFPQDPPKIYISCGLDPHLFSTLLFRVHFMLTFLGMALERLHHR